MDRQKLGERDEFRFRICENLLPDSAMLLFRPSIAPGDEIEVDINGKTIPAKDVKYPPKHKWYHGAWAQGRPPLCSLPLNSPPAVYGDNYLGLKLVKSADEAKGDVILDVVEVIVKPGN